MTEQTQRVLRVMLAEPARSWYGREISAATDLLSGTTSPILSRLEDAGWLESWWEETSDHEAAGRPRRRYYRFTQDGVEQARIALARVHAARPRGRAHDVPVFPDNTLKPAGGFDGLA